MAALFRRSSRVVCQHQRQFTTSSSQSVSLQWDRNDPEALKEVLPPYPYGPTQWYRQSRLGLYGGQRIQFGNNVGERSKVKSRRSWHPNIFTQRLFSRALNRHVQVRVSARVLRTIDKLGGLDEYLLGEKEGRIRELGESGWWLRWAIMQTPGIKKRFATERQLLGLPEDSEETEAVVEGMTASGEDDVSVASTEEVVMDNTFQIEESKDSLPIKFRVGPGQHVILTPEGWRRTRPAPTYFDDKHKNKLFWEAYPDYVGKQLEMVKAKIELQRPSGEGLPHLGEETKQAFLVSTRKRLNKELREKIDQDYKQRMALKETRKEVRQKTKLAREAAKDAPVTSPTPENSLYM